MSAEMLLGLSFGLKEAQSEMRRSGMFGNTCFRHGELFHILVLITSMLLQQPVIIL